MPLATFTAVDTLIRVTEEVFATMVFRTLSTGIPVEGEAVRPQANVVGAVGFAGSSYGLVAFYSTMAAAREIATAMLSGSVADARGQAPDAIGEITNMIAGSFRTQMARGGEAWAITVPTVTVGSDFYIKPLTNGRRVLIPFVMAEHELVVELIMTTPAGHPDAQ